MTTETGNPSTPLIGLDVVGRGIKLRPYEPYELTTLLYPQTNFQPSFTSKETGKTYAVPEGYAVNESPPLPTNQALNQVIIEESFDRFESQLKVDSSVAASNAFFSVDASASQARQLRTVEDAYYAMRSSFIPLWSVYLPDTNPQLPDEFLEAVKTIPAPFSFGCRKQYEEFFDRFGTHFVRRVWIGGKANLAFTIQKSAVVSKTDIHAGLKASFGTAGGGNVNTAASDARDNTLSKSQCTVWGKGGDAFKLATLTNFNEVVYNDWLTSIRNNPQVIELELGGIWTLFAKSHPEQAHALLEAYKAATTFKALSAIFTIGGKVLFLRGNKYSVYIPEEAVCSKPRNLHEDLPFLKQVGFERFDSAFAAGSFYKDGVDVEKWSHTVFLFRKKKVLRVTIQDLPKMSFPNTVTQATARAAQQPTAAEEAPPETKPKQPIEYGVIDPGYPKKIKDDFPGVTFDSIDAVLNTGDGEIYFFSGDKYIRYNVAKNQSEQPHLIKERWVGLTFDRIDAAVYLGHGNAYFFKEDQHIRYDMVTYRTDPGYPKAIVGQYAEDWKFLD